MALPTAPEAILFDLDGTLIDSVPDIAAATRHAFQPWLHTPTAQLPDALVRDWVGRGSARLVEDATTSLGLRQRADQGVLLSRFLRYYQRHPATHSLVYPGVPETLRALQAAGIALGVVTNKMEPIARETLVATGLDGYFQQVIGTGTVAPKPAPDMLLIVCERLQVNPARALFIGDSRHDVAAARAAGMPVAALTWGYNHGDPVAQSEPDLVLDGTLELLAALDMEEPPRRC